MSGQKKLTPPDLKQCQAEKPNGNSFMTLGGSPGLERCTAKPSVIVTERKPGLDGLKGSMALCDECLAVLRKQLGENYATVQPIEKALVVLREILDDLKTTGVIPGAENATTIQSVAGCMTGRFSSSEPNQSVLPGPYEEKPTRLLVRDRYLQFLTAEQIKRIPFDLVRSLEDDAVLALAEPTHASMPLTQHTDKYPMSDWRYEVANEDTVLGYREWLDNKIEQENE